MKKIKQETNDEKRINARYEMAIDLVKLILYPKTFFLFIDVSGFNLKI